MRTLLIAVTATLALATAAASAAQRPVRSIHDLPSRWEGVAGGFTTKVPATFTISKVTKVTREDRRDGLLSATYEVEGSLVFGSRELRVSQVSLNQYFANSDALEMTLVTDDELALAALASVTYDEASNTYKLREIPRQGERRFSFSAPAPRAN